MATGGRPAGPTAETREAVLQAAFRLLATEGPQEVTPVRIHAETGIARTTVYRHWPTPLSMIEEILESATARHEIDELVGSLVHDLPIAVRTITFRFENRPVTAFFRGTQLVNDERSPSMSQRYIAGLIEPVRDVLAAAITRGELTTEKTADQLTSELCGPLFLDQLLLGLDVDHDAVDRAVEAFIARYVDS